MDSRLERFDCVVKARGGGAAPRIAIWKETTNE